MENSSLESKTKCLIITNSFGKWQTIMEAMFDFYTVSPLYLFTAIILCIDSSEEV